jgi:hypothetical protein
MRYLLALGCLFAIVIASPAQATCQMPNDAGRAVRSESTQLYTLTYKGHSYTFWDYKGWDSANQVHSHEVILKDCKLAFSGAGGDEVSWSIGVPRPVAIAFAKKEIERDIKRLGRPKIQALLTQHVDFGLQPEQAEAYKALGFKLPSTTKIYPWIVRK